MVSRTVIRNIFALETLQALVFAHLQTDTNEIVISYIIIKCLEAESCFFFFFFYYQFFLKNHHVKTE